MVTVSVAAATVGLAAAPAVAAAVVAVAAQLPVMEPAATAAMAEMPWT